MAAVALTALLAPAPRPVPAAAAPPSLQQLLDDAGHDGLPFSPALAAVTCPSERGPVKEGADADRSRVSTTVTSTSVAYLSSRAKPSSYPQNGRLAPNERMTWRLYATLLQYKQESDGDLHLVIADSAGRKMIAEMPYGACVPTTSRWQNAIAGARRTFTRTYPTSTSWHYVHRNLTLTGLGLYDPPHGQTGAASNGIELHPVIALTLR